MSYTWLQPTLERISDLLKLPDKHNCYGTARVAPQVAMIAVQFLLLHMHAEDAAPRITPTMEGGLHFEWNGLKSFCSADFNPGMKIAAVHGEECCQDPSGVSVLVGRALTGFRAEAA